MRILALSVAPIFKYHIHGGSQRIFMDIGRYLSAKGHDLKVLCTKRPDNDKPFELDGMMVLPVLNYRETFPMPYMTSSYNLSEIIDTINDEIQDVDLLYIHADGFYFKKFFHGRIPIVTSFHDFCYPISMVSAFLGDSDHVIVPSQYLFDCIGCTVGKQYRNLMERVEVIPNGIDQNLFKRNDERRRRTRDAYGIEEDEKVILFPHRPDESKGISASLDLVDFLVNNAGINKLKIGIPRYIDMRVNNESESFYRYVRDYMSSHGLSNNLFFFDWVYPNKMPDMYEMADLTLCIGNFIESFGLVPLESLCCETPVITSKSGALRYTMKSSMQMPQIDFNDTEALRRYSLEILNGKEFDFEKIREFIEEHYSYEQMLKRYEDAFKNAGRTIHLQMSESGPAPERYRLAPWCYVSPQGVYDDYKREFVEVPENILTRLEKGDYTDFDIDYLKRLHIIIPDY